MIFDKPVQETDADQVSDLVSIDYVVEVETNGVTKDEHDFILDRVKASLDQVRTSYERFFSIIRKSERLHDEKIKRLLDLCNTPCCKFKV